MLNFLKQLAESTASPFRSTVRFVAFVFALAVMISATSLHGQSTTVYVDINNGVDGPPNFGRDGWGQNAHRFLQDALDAADDIISLQIAQEVEIWVAKGAYLPNQGQDLPQVGDQREHSFFLRNNVRLYGGFSGQGTETELHERNPESNPTILSGNLGDTDDDSDNSYHVVQAINVDNSAMLNGFVVRDGRADTGPSDKFNRNGGGIITSDSSPLIIRCVITENKAHRGGGVAIKGAESAELAPSIINSTISNNESTHRGGGILDDSGRLVIVNSLIHGNTARTYGGGILIFAEGDDFEIVNCTITGNTVVGATGSPTDQTAVQESTFR